MGALADRLTAAQVKDWMRYAELEPFGPLAAWQRAGTVASAVANFRPFRSAGGKVYGAKDFTPKFGLTVPAVPQWQKDKAAMMAAVDRRKHLGPE